MSLEAFPTSSSQSAADAIVQRLRRSLDSGDWKSGERLPTERNLSLELGFARNTIRRALKQLEEEGRIIRHVGRGTFVSETKREAPQDLVHRIQKASPAEILEVRLMIEPDAAELATARANGSELDAISECLRRSEAVATVAEFEKWDGLLHQAIVAACRNQLLADIYDAINAVRRKADWAALKERVVTPARRAATEKQHRKIVAAIRDRNAPQAALEMKNHLLDVRRSLVGF